MCDGQMILTCDAPNFYNFYCKKCKILIEVRKENVNIKQTSKKYIEKKH